MHTSDKKLLDILKIALGHDADIQLEVSNWEQLTKKALAQGVIGLVYDAICGLSKNNRPTEKFIMTIYGYSHIIEEKYCQHRSVIGKLSKFYEDQGIKLMILKGYGLSLNYPVPNHRPVGDIDTYNFGLQKIADQILHDRLNIEIDNSHHRHSVFQFDGVNVENHFDFINDYTHRSNNRIEKLLKDLVNDQYQEVFIDGNRIYLPSVKFNSLFLIKHCAGHFASTEMNLRQLLDWLLFVKMNYEQLDWNWLYKVLQKENLDKFMDILNAIGIKYLGFPSFMFPRVEPNVKLVNRVLYDILSPEFKEKEDGSLLQGLWVKPRRWWHNRWKHKICYSDNLFVDFFLNLYSKILKPAHIRF